ncbi:Hsp20/alpha crystallin family protein [Haloarcula litorea]|uniref:Hsp20/alpha crystallin family protein n=1 Tax=Haloarcula litorea TaxID=3032579 RepID=UPI0023E89987|nr:Hsp20/alpha crystallin family protein [Halomicroarcula sp. GDY20]
MRERQYPFDAMEQFFDQMRREMFTGRRGTGIRASDEHGEADWDAGVSIEGTDDGFVVLADLPGFEREELSLTLRGDELRLSGEHAVENGSGYRRRTVSERITLPMDVDPEDADATYRNGVLEVRFVVDEASTDGDSIDIE